MKYAILILMIPALWSCNNDQILHNYTVTKYQKVGDSYKYSEDLLNYKGDTYKPVVSSTYFNDSLSSAEVYKSEGRISYTSKELQADSLFKKSLELAEIRIVQIIGDSLIDNGKRYKIDQRKNDSIFCVDQQTMLLYNAGR